MIQKPKNHIMRITILLLIVVFSNTLYSQINTFKSDFIKEEEQVNKKITSLMKSSNVKGLGIALIDSAGVIWEKGYGYKNYAAKEKINTKTIFCFGSISKIFTGIAIMQLQEQGKLDINKPVQYYIPEFKPLGSEDFINEITIKSILTHQSGLPSDNYAMFFTGKEFSANTIISYFNSHFVCTKPNIIFSYSNVGYSLLGAIIERVSKKDFNTYIKENITLPLGMNNSSFNMEEHMKPLLSKQYYKKNKEYNEPHVSELLPAGGFYSNIEDMSVFTQMLLNKGKLKNIQILNENSFKEMTTIQNGDVHRNYDMNLGLTWFITMDGTWFKAGGSYSHGGNTIVFHSALTVLPYQNLAVVISSNSKNGIRIVPNIERMVLEKALEIKGIDSTFSPQTISKKQIKHFISKENYKDFEGLYSFALKPIQLKAKTNRIILQMSPIAFILNPADDSTFNVKIRVLGISFTTKKISKMWFDIIDNDTILVINSWDRNFYFSNKMPELKHSTIENWKKIDGKYTRLDNETMLKTATIKVKKNYIILKSDFFNQKIRFTITPILENQAKVNGLGRSTGDVIQFLFENEKTSFEFAGITYKKSSK